jgi:hypothetical protein
LKELFVTALSQMLGGRTPEAVGGSSEKCDSCGHHKAMPKMDTGEESLADNALFKVLKANIMKISLSSYFELEVRYLRNMRYIEKTERIPY